MIPITYSSSSSLMVIPCSDPVQACMDRLNSLPKYEDAGHAPGDLTFTQSRGLWWVNEANDAAGYGYWYKTLEDAVRRWRVSVHTMTNDGRWLASPA